MFNILKAEFKKFLKGKTIIAIIIVTIIFPIFTAGMYKILDGLVSNNDGLGIDSIITAPMAFYSSFSPMQNYGLILLIFVLVLVINDFTQSTIRNKLIAGYDRKVIYTSTTLFAMIIMIVAVTLYAFLSYFLTGILISFGNVSFGEIAKFYLFAITSLITIYSFVILASFSFKRLGPTLGIVLGVLFALTIAFSIIMVGLKEDTIKIILIIAPFLKIFNALFVSDANFLVSIFINLLYASGLTTLGLLVTEKMDFK